MKSKGSEALVKWFEKNSNVTKKSIANKIGISGATLSNYLSGKCKPIKEKRKIIQALINIAILEWDMELDLLDRSLPAKDQLTQFFKTSGMTKKEFGDKTGYNPDNIYRWTSGISKPQQNYRLKIEKLTGIKPDDWDIVDAEYKDIVDVKIDKGIKQPFDNPISEIVAGYPMKSEKSVHMPIKKHKEFNQELKWVDIIAVDAGKGLNPCKGCIFDHDECGPILKMLTGRDCHNENIIFISRPHFEQCNKNNTSTGSWVQKKNTEKLLKVCFVFDDGKRFILQDGNDQIQAFMFDYEVKI